MQFCIFSRVVVWIWGTILRRNVSVNILIRQVNFRFVIWTLALLIFSIRVLLLLHIVFHKTCHVAHMNAQEDLICATHHTLALFLPWLVDQSSCVSRWLQPGDLTRNALNATSLFGLSGVTKHVQLGFSLLPLLLPQERDPTVSDRGVILVKEVGCLWEKESLLLLSEQFSFLFYNVLCRLCGNCLPPP